jgi:hypothetical protein
MKRGPEYYIQQLEIIRDLEGRNLLRSEVVIKFQEIIVAQLLDAADGELVGDGNGTKELLSQQASTVHPPYAPIREHVFISYSHKDKKWLDKLYTFLKPLLRENVIKIWVDTQIDPGDTWLDEINKALASAKVAVLLVSPNFLASDFIMRHELSVILEAAQQEGLTILWVAVSESVYKHTAIATYQAVNDPSKPCDCLRPSHLNKELVLICEQIKHAVDETIRA